MAFTGRLGTPNSRFADIVFAAVDGFGPAAPDFQAHQLTSRRFRVLFNLQVTESALSAAAYSLSAVGSGTVPPIVSVTWYDETHDSVVIEVSAPLTTSAQYTVSVSSVEGSDGDFVLSAAKNFTANVVDPPRARGAFLSKRGHVDVLFDKPVGPYSSGASFSIRDASGGPAVAMTQAAWGGEGIPETTLRLQIPAGVPTANAFVISTSAVEDYSQNTSAEDVPLTLVLRSPAPYSYADLTQLQLTDAFVTDVSSDFLRTANVRVFFSCPVQGATSRGSWSVFAEAAHRRTDDQDVLTAPPATDLPSLIVLLNDLKSVLNSHLRIDQVHLARATADLVTAPDASDLPTSVDLANALIGSLPGHMLRPRVHVYLDTVNAVSLAPVPPGDLPAAVSAANALALSYSGHLEEEYPLSFSEAYQSPIGDITAYAEELVPDLCMDVEGPHTYYADLRVILDVERPSLRVEASLTSEDGGSSCSPSDYTGNIVARSADHPVTVLSSLVSVDEAVSLRTDRNVDSVSDSPLVIVGEDGVEIPTTPELAATLPSLLWAYNNALEAYRRHIVPGAAGHQVDDDVNIVTPSDYAFLPLASAMSGANDVRQKVMAHMASAIYHYHADPTAVTAPPATDLESFAVLVADLAYVLSSHLVRVGPHVFAGYRMVSAPVFDVMVLSSAHMRDGTESRARGSLMDHHVYNGLPVSPPPAQPAARSHLVPVDLPFVALAVRPSLASALPQSGLSFDPVRGPKLEADAVQAFFSKPMREVPVTPANLSFTGGSIQFIGSGWVSPSLASVAVTRMENIPYSLVASGMTDVAGNEVY